VDEDEFDLALHSDFFPAADYPGAVRSATLEVVDTAPGQILTMAWTASTRRADVVRAWADRPWERAHFHLDDPVMPAPWTVRQWRGWTIADHPDCPVVFGVGPGPIGDQVSAPGELVPELFPKPLPG